MQDDSSDDDSEDEQGKPPSKRIITRSTKIKRTITKRRTVCLQNLYDEEDICIRSNNVRLRSLDDSSDDQSESF